MTVDLDQIFRWDLSLTIGGATRPTRPLVPVDIAAIQTLEPRLQKGDAAAETEFRKMVATLFVEPPDTSDWGLQQCIGVVTAVTSYFKGSAEKNSLAISAIVAAEMA